MPQPLPPVGYAFVANFIYRSTEQSGQQPVLQKQQPATFEEIQKKANHRPSTDVNSVDIRFQKVSGFRTSMSPHTLDEGGQNTFTHRLPNRYSYDNLVLERGLVLNSDLSEKFLQALVQFKFNPCTVLVSLLDEKGDPAMSWAFFDAWPVSWSSSDLDANSNSIVIETLELAYTRFQRMKL